MGRNSGNILNILNGHIINMNITSSQYSVKRMVANYYNIFIKSIFTGLHETSLPFTTRGVITENMYLNKYLNRLLD